MVQTKFSGTINYLSIFFFSSKEFAKKVKALLGPNGSTVFDKRRDKSFLRKVEELAGSMREFQKDKEPGNLKEYSSWLSSFKADAFGNDLEIPGRRGGAGRGRYSGCRFWEKTHIWRCFLLQDSTTADPSLCPSTTQK